jgi:hypothetical protein
VWTLTSAAVVNENGTAVPGGAGTGALAIANGLVYGEDAATGSWYTYSTASQLWTAASAPPNATTPTPPPTPTPVPTPSPTPAPQGGASTGSFHVANGQIIAPGGQTFIAKGINIYWDQLSSAVGNGTTMPLTTAFPGLSMVRVNFEGPPGSGYPDVSQFEAQVNALTAKGIVVELEDHTGISNQPYTGAQLATEQAWYSSLATTFKDNPYVWFGTYNEPGNGTDLAGIAAQELATYNTIRAAGDNAPILMEEPSGGNPGLVGADATGYDGAGPMTPSDYAGMHNIVWDLHSYGWDSGYSTDQATVSAALEGSASGASGIAGAQTITSADGTVPVIIGEFGNSTTGNSIDGNANQVIQAIASSGKGFLAWGWNPGAVGDQLTDGSGNLTSYGQQIASIIGSTPPTPPPTATAAASPSPIAVSAGAPPASITLASGVASDTVSTSQVSIAATSGNHMLFLSGSGDSVSLSGGADTVTDSGGANSYVLPAAGNGTITFTGNILAMGDTLDLRTALAATNWNGSASTLSNYLTVAESGTAATVSIAAKSGGSSVTLATIDGAGSTSLASLLAHAIT